MRKVTIRYDYVIPGATRLGDDCAANLAHFLLDNAGSIHGTWSGHMRAADQRRLFGRFLGKGQLFIDGAHERVAMTVKVCFGTDWDTRENVRWSELRMEGVR